jgi:hypothetical protein
MSYPATTDPPAPASSGRAVGRATPVLEPVRDELEARLPHGAAEVPGLAAVLVAAQAIDRAVAYLVDGLLDLDEHQVAETITGVPLEQWLALVGRRTRADRRMLLATCDVLRRLPTLRTAFLDDGSVSWAQTRAIVLEVEPLPHHLDDAIDDALATCIRTCRDDDPDSLVGAVNRAVRSIEATAEPATSPTSPDRSFLAMQPRLDGTGGRIHGELDALGFATVDAALTPSPAEVADDPGPRGGALARGRARRLVDLCDLTLAGGVPDAADGCAAPDEHGAAGSPGAGTGGRAETSSRGSRPQLIIRVELSTLLDRDDLPAALLTTLMGGKLWIDAQTARQLVEARGADLRSVVLDDTGRVVGVGRRTRVPTSWLRDAALALHDTCSAPGCLRPARAAELDHALPWEPIVSGGAGGPTDVAQLAPLCRSHNGTKESAGWRVTQTADGVRRWEHPATGLAATTRPATWFPRRAPGYVAAIRGRSTDVARERRGAWDVDNGRGPPRQTLPSPGPGPRCRGPGAPRLRAPGSGVSRLGGPRFRARRSRVAWFGVSRHW